jgi:hypothetical protein
LTRIAGAYSLSVEGKMTGLKREVGGRIVHLRSKEEGKGIVKIEKSFNYLNDLKYKQLMEFNVLW